MVVVIGIIVANVVSVDNIAIVGILTVGQLVDDSLAQIVVVSFELFALADGGYLGSVANETQASSLIVYVRHGCSLASVFQVSFITGHKLLDRSNQLLTYLD